MLFHFSVPNMEDCPDMKLLMQKASMKLFPIPHVCVTDSVVSYTPVRFLSTAARSHASLIISMRNAQKWSLIHFQNVTTHLNANVPKTSLSIIVKQKWE
jgi:hypothetical protein